MSNTEQNTSTLPANPTANPRKTVSAATYKRRTTIDPAKCVLQQRIIAIREAEAAGRRREAETLKNQLITSSRGFIRKAAQKFYGDDVEQEDVDATALLGFWRAVTTWLPDGGSPFDTWARWGMRLALQKMIRGTRMIRGQKQERVSLASLEGDDIDETDWLCGSNLRRWSSRCRLASTPPSNYQGGTPTVAGDGRRVSMGNRKGAINRNQPR